MRLSKSNVTVVVSNNAIDSYTITALTLSQYRFNIMYSATIQSLSVSISINVLKARLLSENSRLLQATTFSFSIPILSYPPAIYYPPSTNNTYAGLGILIHILCAITLAFSVIGFFGVKRTVFYSMELFNMMVMLYVMEGMGLINYSDWIAFSISSMKSYTLVGGFSLGVCQCFAAAAQYQYGYCDQLFENAGVIMVIDACILALLLVAYGIFRSTNGSTELKDKSESNWSDKVWIFGKYYVLAFLLVFNANVAFSSFLMLFNSGSINTSVAAANIAIAAIMMAFSLAFFVMLIMWTKELSVTIVYPDVKE